MRNDNVDIIPSCYLTGGEKFSRDAFSQEIKNGLGEYLDKKPKHLPHPRLFPDLYSLLEVNIDDIHSMDTKR